MSFRTGKRRDGSTYKFPIDKGIDYVPSDLEVQRIPSQPDPRFQLLHDRIIQMEDRVSVDDPRIVSIVKTSRELFKNIGWNGAARFSEIMLDNPSNINVSTVENLRHLIHLAMLNDEEGYMTYEKIYLEDPDMKIFFK